MLDTIFKPIEKVVKSRLGKLKLKEKLSKHPDYMAKAKEIWALVDQDLGISDKVENKLKPKIEKFNKTLKSKFPELTEEDVTELRETIVGKINAGKDSVLGGGETIKELKDSNTKLQEENAALKEQLSKIQSVVTTNVVTASSESSTTTTTDEK